MHHRDNIRISLSKTQHDSNNTRYLGRKYISFDLLNIDPQGCLVDYVTLLTISFSIQRNSLLFRYDNSLGVNKDAGGTFKVTATEHFIKSPRLILLSDSA